MERGWESALDLKNSTDKINRRCNDDLDIDVVYKMSR